MYNILVGADAFWRRAEADIRAARSRVFVQAMTFEGDRAGLAVAGAIRATAAADRRVIVDSYSKHVISDRFVCSPALLRRAFRSEVAATRAMFRDLEEEAVGVCFSNPLGFLGHRYPLRNHKKLIVVDDRISYIGGVNFSDHNFAWQDLMVRIDSPVVANFLRDDFLRTWEGRSEAASLRTPHGIFHSLNGRNNAAGYAALFEAIAQAQDTIYVLSPYLSMPFTNRLAVAAKRGVRVVVITPQPNNKRLVRDALLRDCARFGFEVLLLPHMSHLKAMLIDGQQLVIGSSNFDFVSYHTQEELYGIIADPEVCERFRADVLQVAIDESKRKPLQGSKLREYLANGVLQLAAQTLRLPNATTAMR